MRKYDVRVVDGLLRVRLYQTADRESVRRICCDTADRGEPVERFFNDRDVFADLWTRYYTDFEPEHLWVLEECGRVAGYLSASWDEFRFQQRWVRSLLVRIFLKALVRGVFFLPQTWRLLRTNRQLALRRSVEPSLADYPVHFHINLDRDIRGQGGGRLLMESFLAQARGDHRSGLTAATRIDNTPIAHFLERFGFQKLFEGRTFLVPGQRDPRKIVWGLRL